MLNTNTQRNRGDTIVEALLALAIAAFAIGIAYATANRSLQQAITARERNQALNLIQNQITDLRIRYGTDTANFSTNFGFGGSNDHFCLNDQATALPTVPTDPQWTLYQNKKSGGEATTLQGAGNPYDDHCVRNIPGQGTPFYIDITTKQVPFQAAGVNDTVFQVFVRWERIGGGPINQASLFFRPNGNIN